ncbi:MAG: DUF1572 domain-containing protein [Gilvibacter sp.]
MSTIQHFSKHIHTVHFGGNWTCVNLKDTLEDVYLKEATTKVGDCNTIAVLVFHINYFVEAILEVLQNRPLVAHDKYSFDHPPLNSEADWEAMKQNSYTKAQLFSDLVKELPEEKLWENFWDKKYGNYYSNIQGIIEHTHYHLGQISIIKKMLRSES